MSNEGYCVKCPSCSTVLRVSPQSAGKTATCPRCKNLMTLPALPPGTAFAPPAYQSPVPPAPGQTASLPNTPSPSSASGRKTKPPFVARLGGLIALPLAALLLGFFFLPWIKMNENRLSTERRDDNYATASGLQLVRGDLSIFEDGRPITRKNVSEMLRSRAWYVAVPVAAAICIAMGILIVCGVCVRPLGAVLCLLAAAGITFLFLAPTVNYGGDRVAQEFSELRTKDAAEYAKLEQKWMERFDKEVSVSGTAFLWISLAACFGILGGGVVSIILGGLRPKMTAPQPAYAQQTIPMR